MLDSGSTSSPLIARESTKLVDVQNIPGFKIHQIPNPTNF